MGRRPSRFTLFLICVALATSPAPRLLAQAPEQRDVIKVFQIRYVNIDQLKQLLGIFPAQTTASANALSVKASREVVDAIEETIKRLDVPPPVGEEKAAELTIFVLTPSDQPSGPLPAVLGPVVAQLNSIFTYKGLRLIDTLVVRSAARTDPRPDPVANQSSASGTLAIGSTQAPASYTFSAAFELRKTERHEPYVYLQGMNFSVSAPHSEAAGGLLQGGLRTNLEIRPGQQVVVGKTTIGGDPLILVMSARFLD